MYNVFLGPGTYMGDPYPADEAAKALVAKLGLQKGQTVSRDQIIEFISELGLSQMWATDVAMVLRDMFGVTPTYFENTSLVSELHGILTEDDASDLVDDVTDTDLSTLINSGVDEAFAKAADAEEQAIIAALALESTEVLAAIASLPEYFTNEQLDEAVEVAMVGDSSLLESWVTLAVRPHMARFIDSNLLDKLAEVIGIGADVLIERVRGDVKQQRRQMANQQDQMRARVQARAQLGPDADVSALKKRSASNLATTITNRDREDPLAQRAKDAAGGANLAMRYRLDKGAAGMKAAMAGGTSAQGERAFKNKALQTATNKMAKGTQSMSFPQDPAKPATPGPSMFHKAISKAGDIAGRVKNAIGSMGTGGQVPGKHLPSNGPANNAQAQAPGLGSKIGAAAKTVAGGVGSALARGGNRLRGLLAAKMRMRHPALAHLLYGNPGEHEQHAARHMGLAHNYAQLGYELPGLQHQYAQTYLRHPQRRPSAMVAKDLIGRPGGQGAPQQSAEKPPRKRRQVPNNPTFSS